MTESYVCIDLETTGLNPKRDKIIEIGAVKVVDNRITEEWETLVNPGRKLEEHVTELTGIRDEQLSQAPGIEEVLPKLLAMTEHAVLLGHRVLFDFSFIKKAAVDRRLCYERSGIDTLKIARRYLADLESRGLEYLCRYYHIRHSAHRALGDARATVELYRKLGEQFYEKEEARGPDSLFRPAPLVCHIKRDTPITVSQKEQLYKLAERHRLVLDYDVERLSRSEASQRIDRLLAEYGR